MPVSKHRRKPGGKSVRHPGHGKVPTVPPLPPDLQAWQKFRDGYIAPFRAALEGNMVAHEILDMVADRAWQYNTPCRRSARLRYCGNWRNRSMSSVLDGLLRKLNAP